VLDLSSFKCGHDAPTYGIIDAVISKAATPYSALHDIDANKPGGSIKIRVKTYAHALKLHEERLDDLATRRKELDYRMDLKRVELMELKRAQLEARKTTDPQITQQIEAVKARIAAYEATRPMKPVLEDKPAGLVSIGVKRNDKIARVGA